MKRWLKTLAIAATLSGTLCLHAGALAYPVEVQYPLEASGPIQKTYMVQQENEISQLPREPFSLGDVFYSYQDTICKPILNKEEQPLTQTETLEVNTKDPDAILATLEQSRNVTMPDGSSGVLTLQSESLVVEPATYGSSSSTKTLSRTYPNLSDADLNLIPKEVTADGRTYTLSNISWTEGSAYNPYDEEVKVRYTASAVYSTTVTSRYTKTYTATVSYAGTVSRITDEGYECVLIFYPDSSVAETDTAATAKKEVGVFRHGAILVLLVIFMAAVAGIELYRLLAQEKKADRRDSKRKKSQKRKESESLDETENYDEEELDDEEENLPEESENPDDGDDAGVGDELLDYSGFGD